MKNIIHIGKFEVGNGRTLVIAEIGSNHASSLNVALESINAAHAAGADAVKFQSIKIDSLYCNPREHISKLHRKIDLPEEWYLHLKMRCDELGLIFLSSPTYLGAVNILESLSVSLYKLASAQVAIFPQLVERVASLGKPVLLSTGLVTENELTRVVEIFRKVGNNKFIILHCNTMYPAYPEIVHLPRMLDYHRKFDCAIGFSDHTISNVAAISAVATGASVIERHFTIDRNLDSPDAPFSLEPNEFKEMVLAIRETELINKSSPREILEIEESTFRGQIQHTLIATKDISAGQLIDDSNSALMRGNLNYGIDAWTVYNLTEPFAAVRDIKSGVWLNHADIRTYFGCA